MKTTALTKISLDDLGRVHGGADGVEWQPACSDPRGYVKRLLNAVDDRFFPGPACLKAAIHPDQMVITAPATMYDGTQNPATGKKGVILNGAGFTAAGNMLGNFTPPSPQ
jgi:hypothetical protein